MALTAFTSRLGRGQGRLLTPTATGGDYAFVLGDAEPGRFFELAPGDHAEVTQSTDLTGVMLVRALLRLSVPASTPAGLAWEASIMIDGTKIARMRAKPGRERLVTDLAANVSKLSGVHTVGVRLELVSA
ncbi:hypothetical protein [Corallococcus exercitus]|uniref:hypothetical protein n=1 Tax=Corallococcus exercitus TaxID=2316736 RepID=UPI0035D43713